MTNNPSVRDEFCRVCNTPLKDKPKRYTQYRKYCSEECQTIWKKDYNTKRANKTRELLIESKSKLTPTLLAEPELCDYKLKDTLISLNMIEFKTDNKTLYGVRVGLMQKIREFGIEHKILPSFKIVKVLKNGSMQDEQRKYNTMHITPENFFKLVVYHRELYLKTNNYTNLHSYKNIIKNCQIFMDYVNNLKIIEGK